MGHATPPMGVTPPMGHLRPPLGSRGMSASEPHCLRATRWRRCSKMALRPPLSPTKRWNLRGAERSGRSCRAPWKELPGEVVMAGVVVEVVVDVMLDLMVN